MPRVCYNPDLKSRWFYVPAVLAMILMIMTMLLSAMAVVREKEIGTLEQLMVTPIASVAAPRRQAGAVRGHRHPAGVPRDRGGDVFWFGVPLRGSFLLLLGITQLFLLNTLGLGLLVSTLVRNQQQAMMAAAFLVMMPMIYLSGLIFPIENMPQVIQSVTYAIPLRYYSNVIRGIFLKGAGLDDALARVRHPGGHGHEPAGGRVASVQEEAGLVMGRQRRTIFEPFATGH